MSLAALARLRGRRRLLSIHVCKPARIAGERVRGITHGYPPKKKESYLQSADNLFRRSVEQVERVLSHCKRVKEEEKKFKGCRGCGIL